MAWKLGEVQTIDTGLNGFSGPGFVIQQEGRSPSLTFVFNDERVARKARDVFEREILSAASWELKGDSWRVSLPTVR